MPPNVNICPLDSGNILNQGLNENRKIYCTLFWQCVYFLLSGFHHPLASSNAAAGLVTLTPVNFALPNSSQFNSMSALDIQPFHHHQPAVVTVTNPQSIYKLMTWMGHLFISFWMCPLKRTNVANLHFHEKFCFF